MRFILLFLLFFASPSFAIVSLDYSKTGAGQFRTPLESCSAYLVVTPADADMVINSAHCYRDGKFLYIRGQVDWNGAGTAGDVTIDFTTYPGSPTIDTTLIANSGGGGNNKNEAYLGHGKYFNSGGSFNWVSVVYATSTTFEFALGSAHLAGNAPPSGSSLSFEAKLPILGWN